MEQNSILFSWCADTSKTDELTEFFYQNLLSDTDYISHSEIQEGRALSANEWSPKLKSILNKSVLNHLAGQNDDGSRGALAFAQLHGKIVGILQISYCESPHMQYAVLEDLIVCRSTRSKGFGSMFVRWLYEQLKKQCIEFIFLESGIRNARAHAFFKAVDYTVVSQVMVSKISYE